MAKKTTKRGRGGSKGASEARLARLRNEWYDLNYRLALPFKVHDGGLLCPLDMPSDFDFRRYEWDERVCAVAQAALAAGYSLGVSVPSNVIAQASSALARTLKCRCLCMGYDAHAGMLVLWDVAYDDEHYEDGNGES